MENLNFTFISGATGGLGSQFAISLATQGKNLFLTARSDEKLNILSDKLKEISPNITVLKFACDLTNSENRQEMFDYIKENDVKFDALINVAGADIQKTFLQYTEEKLTFQTRVLFEGTISITRYLLSISPNGLKILTISSICGTLPIPYFAIYSAQKSALVTFFDALRYELKKDKRFTVTTILPGSIPTRPDIIGDIKKQGLTGKLSQKSPEYIVKKSLKALDNRKKNYIPGFYNKVVNFFQKITPKFIKIKIIASKFSNKEKDAF